MKKPNRKKLSTKLMLGLTVFALLNLIFIPLFVGIDYYLSEKAEYTDLAFSLARAASRFIDGDRVPDYLNVVGADENGQPVYFTDAYYDEVMAYLASMQQESRFLKYYYVVVPHEDSFTYVWDAVTAENASPQGTEEAYVRASREVIGRAFSREPVQEIAVYRDENWGDIARACYPICDSAGEPVAVVGVDLSVDGMVGVFLHYFLLIFAAIFLVTAVTAAVVYALIKRVLLRPIEQLNQAAKGLVEGLDEGKRPDLEIQTGDELEELAGSFRKMDDDLRGYIDRLSAATAEREHLHAEFEIAKQIQAGILPNEFPAFDDRREFDIRAAICPGSEICGDFYDFFLIDDDHLAMAVGDVSDKGVPAALYMVMAETLMKSRAQQGFSPAEVLQSIGEQLPENETEMFAMVLLAVLEISTGEGVAVNAGYQHPVLRRAGKKFELQRYRHFPPVAAAKGVRFRDHGFRLEPGDTLFLYSDGVRDAVNGQGEFFGEERILKALNWEPEATPSVLLQTVSQAVDRFAEGTEQMDDQAMLALKYSGPDAG